MKSYLSKVIQGSSLSYVESQLAMQLICHQSQDEAHKAALIAALHVRGETQTELAGFLDELRQPSQLMSLNSSTVLGICGTGGDQSFSINISTAAALLVASYGIHVVKLGGTSVSSATGSADVVSALNITTDHDITEVQRSIDSTSFSFIRAIDFNQHLHNILPLRKKLSIRSCFNIVAPLLNPIKMTHQIIGVYDKRLLKIIAYLLQRSGCHDAMIVHAHDGMDEISICSPTDVVHISPAGVRELTIYPRDYGFVYHNKESVRGGNAEDNANIIRSVLQGKLQGAYRDVIVLNAAAGFLLTGHAASLQDAIVLGNDCITNGLSAQLLAKLTHVS